MSRYPLVEVRVAVDRLGSAKAGSQPLFLDKGKPVWFKTGDGRLRVILCISGFPSLLSEKSEASDVRGGTWVGSTALENGLDGTGSRNVNEKGIIGRDFVRGEGKKTRNATVWGN